MKKEKKRCTWCLGDPLYEFYHDQEWGVPLSDDNQLFEFLILETFQAGLSWITILRKRENFRKAFDGFDFELIANYSEAKIQELIQDPGIIRNKLKIHAAIDNAKAFIVLREEFGTFSKYVWSFVDNKPVQNYWQSHKEVPDSTPTSISLSKDLKRQGFKFIGPTVIYAHMQATGMVNDHTQDCFRHTEIAELSTEFIP